MEQAGGWNMDSTVSCLVSCPARASTVMHLCACSSSSSILQPGLAPTYSSLLQRSIICHSCLCPAQVEDMDLSLRAYLNGWKFR